MGNINVPALMRVAIALVAILVVAVLIFVFVQQQSVGEGPEPVEIGATPTELAQLNRLGISVQGQAMRSVEPDHAIVSLGIEAVGPSSAEATAELSQKSNQIVTAAGDVGVAEADIQTSGLSLWPVYGDTNELQQPTILGYRASANYRITVRVIDDVAAVLDAALAAGANSIDGVQFASTAIEAARQELLAEATQEAARKAEAIAAALDGRLGGLIWLDEEYSSFEPPTARAFAAEAVGVGGAPAVSAGSLTVTVRVRANFGFENN